MKALNILVDIKVQTMGYEKSSYVLLCDVPEDRKQYAFLMACTLEGHCELEIEGDSVNDGGYEFMYSPRGEKVVSPEDMIVLEKYMYSFAFDMDAVRNIKGFEE